MRIETEYRKTPIPFRGWDWTAVDMDCSSDTCYNGDANSPIGQGATEAEAITNLLDKIEAEAD